MLKKIKISIVALLCVLLIPVISFSEISAVTFEWNANTESNLAGYRIYQSELSAAYVFGVTSSNFLVEIPCGPNEEACTTYTKQVNADPGQHYVVTAYDTNGNESLPSNEVCTLPPGQTTNFRFIH